MTDLKPTDPHIALAKAIKAGQVVDHGWRRGRITWSHNLQQDTVTAAVGRFRAAGLLEAPDTNGEKPPYPVRFNAAGEAWLAEHGGAS